MSNSIHTAIRHVLKYYDYFKYPLTTKEIWSNFPIPVDETTLSVALDKLISENQIFQIGPFYSIQNSQAIIENRLLANKLATEKMNKALQLTQFIKHFPFVKAAFISGSLSKNVAGPETDIDYFIVTQPGKVWIARTLLHLFKKLTFINGRQHDFCMNYFIDLSNPVIEEKNLYTAIELNTLKAHPKDQNFLIWMLHQNLWTKTYLPNYPLDANTSVEILNPPGIIDQVVFNPLNHALMQITNFVWRRKWKRKGYPMDDYDVAFKTRIHVSKNHPDNYLKKMLRYCDESGIPAA